MNEPAAYPPVSLRSPHRFVWVMLIVIVLVLAGVAYALHSGVLGTKGVMVGSAPHTLVVSFNSLDPQGAFTLSISNATTTLRRATLPVSLTASVPKRSVLEDVVGSATSTYYLLLDPLTTHSALYTAVSFGQQSGKNVESLVPLTASSSFKAHVSFDAKAGLMAYEESTSTNAFKSPDRSITVLTLADKKEHVVAVGHSPSLRGTSLFYIHGSHLEMRAPYDAAPVTLISLATGTPYALDTSSATSTIVTYNPATHSLDYFAIQNGGASYLHSMKILILPQALAFVNGDVYEAFSTATGMSVEQGSGHIRSVPTPAHVPFVESMHI